MSWPTRQAASVRMTVGALVLSAVFAGCGLRQALAPSAGAARSVLYASLLYLPSVLALLALDKRWDGREGGSASSC